MSGVPLRDDSADIVLFEALGLLGTAPPFIDDWIQDLCTRV